MLVWPAPCGEKSILYNKLLFWVVLFSFIHSVLKTNCKSSLSTLLLRDVSHLYIYIIYIDVFLIVLIVCLFVFNYQCFCDVQRWKVEWFSSSSSSFEIMIFICFVNTLMTVCFMWLTSNQIMQMNNSFILMLFIWCRF